MSPKNDFSKHADLIQQRSLNIMWGFPGDFDWPYCFCKLCTTCIVVSVWHGVCIFDILPPFCILKYYKLIITNWCGWISVTVWPGFSESFDNKSLEMSDNLMNISKLRYF